MLRHPRDVLVQFEHAVFDCCDFDKPRRHGTVNERLSTAPAVRIGVVVGVVTNYNSSFLQVPDHIGIGLKYVTTRPICYLCGVSTVLIHRTNRRNIRSLASCLVIFTESWCQVNDARSVLSRDKFRTNHLKCIFCIREVRKHRGVFLPHQFVTLDRARTFDLTEFTLICRESCLSDHVIVTI